MTPRVKPTDEFRKLISLFPEGDELFGDAEHIPALLTPEPYKRLLVLDRHMSTRADTRPMGRAARTKRGSGMK